MNFPNRGVDVSHFNDVPDWSLVRKAGFDFAIAKASDGIGIDPKFLSHVAAATKAGVAVGAYHFLRPRDQAIDQANVFLRQIRMAKKNGMTIQWAAVDVEDPGDEPGAWLHISLQERREKVLHWMAAVKDSFPAPLIYCIPRWWSVTMGKNPAFSAYPLWAASIGHPPRLENTPWKEYALWQFDQHGAIPDVAGTFDFDQPPP